MTPHWKMTLYPLGGRSCCAFRLRPTACLIPAGHGEAGGPGSCRARMLCDASRGCCWDRRGRLHGQLLRLREVARRLERLRRRSLAATAWPGSSLSAAGAVAAIVGLSLSPVTLGSAAGVGRGAGWPPAGGAVTITSDPLPDLLQSRELRRVQDRGHLPGPDARDAELPRLLLPGRAAETASCCSAEERLHRAVQLGIFHRLWLPRGFLVPSAGPEGATRVSQAVLKAKIQKLAESPSPVPGLRRAIE